MRKGKLEVVSIEIYRQAVMFSEAAVQLYGSSVEAKRWYAFLSDLKNSKYDWVWDDEKNDD